MRRDAAAIAALDRPGRVGIARSGAPATGLHASCVELESGALRHRPIGSHQEVAEAGWLDGVRSIGITAGASTPNNKIGETIARVCAVRGVAAELESAVV